MNNELQAHKTSDRIKWLCTLAGFIVIGVMLIGIICGMAIKKDDDSADGAENGVIVTLPDNTGSGVGLTKTTLPSAQYAVYGISEQAESAFTITATVTDEYGQTPEPYQQVTYAMAWATESQENIDDYVTMTVNGTTAVFGCLKGFNTQIIVTCTSVMDESKTATAVLDYARRVIGVNAKTNGKSVTVLNGGVLELDFSSYGAIGDTDWQQEILSTYAGHLFDATGTKNDSATSSPNFKVEFTEEYKAKLNAIKPELTVNYSAATNGTIFTQETLICGMLDLPYNPQNFSNWYYVMRAFEETENQLKVTVGQNYAHSSSQVVYYLNCKVPATKIGGVSLDGTGYTF